MVGESSPDLVPRVDVVPVPPRLEPPQLGHVPLVEPVDGRVALEGVAARGRKVPAGRHGRGGAG